MPNGKQEPPHNNQHPQPSRPKEWPFLIVRKWQF
jgi:hypothetical protein